MARPTPAAPGDGEAARGDGGRHDRRRHGPAPGAGALQRVRDVALRRHQAGRGGHQGRAPQAVALLPGQLRWLGTGRRPALAPDAAAVPARTRVGAMSAAADPGTGVSSAAAPPAPPWSGTPCARCSTTRTPTGPRPWSTSAAAPAGSRSGSPSSATGWSSSTPAPTPSPRWPGAPTRAGSPTWSPAGRATWPACPTWCPTGSADVVLCHGVLEIVDDPAAALAALAAVLRPGGTLSLLVNQRHAAVVARAMAGHFAAGPGAARRRPGRGGRRRPARRFTADEVTAVLDAAGFDTARDARASGCSSTWCPARWSTSSPVPPRPWSSSSRRSRPVPSTSPWPPSSTPWPIRR